MTDTARPTRRALMGGALAAAGLLAHVPGRARAEAPRRQGTLRVHLLGLDTADPHRHTGSIAVQQVYVEALTSIADDGRALPYLAESWAIEDGGKRYVFRIRENVRFHNGRVLTAADVRANAERVRDKVRGGWLSAPMRLVESLEALDERTFVMTMKEPYGPLLNLLSELWIVAPESEGWDQTIRTPIGTGPFRFGRWVPNEVFHAPAFDRYWQPGLPRAEAVEFSLRDLEDPTLALRAGDLHIARARAAALPELARDPAIEIQFMKDTSWFFWSFNNRSPRAPFDRPTVRQALSFAMDKPAIMRLVAGDAGVVTNQMAAPGQFWFDQAIHDADAHARPDLERARAMLRAEGVEPARTPLRIVSWQTDYAQVAAQAMRSLGFQVEHLALDDLGAQRRLGAYDWDLAPFASGPRADIFLRFVRMMSDGPNPGLWGGVRDAEFDALVRGAVAAVDLAERRRLYLAAWKRAMDGYYTVVAGHAAEAIANRREVMAWSPGFTWGANRVDGGAAFASLG
ncbi:ABC transporter substrate-binding protein [Elioraea rosea]|uniref:ABC transporter substrate-binding protein n=1 Tax=Elioraea rosea TaxID=2492390 RepID=UPI0011836559|nr:ABC transporter substrate-binding protein [Elioraea rosea]